MKRILFLLILLGACTKTVYVPQVSTIRQVDTLTRVEQDSALFSALLDCDSNNRVVIRQLEETRSKMADQSIRFDSGRIEYITRWQTRYVDRISEKIDTIRVIQPVEVEKRVRYVPRVYKLMAFIGLLYVLALVLRLKR